MSIANGQGPGLEIARQHHAGGSWRIERTLDGRYRAHLYVIMDGQAVLAEATLDFPNQEIARILLGAAGEMLRRMPPEIVRPDGTVAAPAPAAAPEPSTAAKPPEGQKT